jgi:hypothetical protein
MENSEYLIGVVYTAIWSVVYVIILDILYNFEIYKPEFHIKVIELLFVRVVVLKQGIHLPFFMF